MLVTLFLVYLRIHCYFTIPHIVFHITDDNAMRISQTACNNINSLSLVLFLTIAINSVFIECPFVCRPNIICKCSLSISLVSIVYFTFVGPFLPYYIEFSGTYHEIKINFQFCTAYLVSSVHIVYTFSFVIFLASILCSSAYKMKGYLWRSHQCFYRGSSEPVHHDLIFETGHTLRLLFHSTRGLQQFQCSWAVWSGTDERISKVPSQGHEHPTCRASKSY